MALTRPIPRAAQKVVEILRRDVERPDKLPHLFWGCTLGWPNDSTDLSVESFGDWFDEQRDPIATVNAIWPETTNA